jgi:hypothetical protein
VVGFVVAVNNFGDTRSGGLAGPMGLFIIVLMSIAVVLLIRNMNKRVRRLPDSFPDPEATRRGADAAKLDADPAASGGESPPPQVDESRSRSAQGGTESEVNGGSAVDPPASSRVRRDQRRRP